MLNKLLKLDFTLRQIYRVFIIWPYEAAIFLFFKVANFFDQEQKEGNKTFFLITSVIYFSEKRLTYSETRSVYSPADRIKQTLETIASIKKFVPDAQIILFEGGLQENLPELKNAVDNFVFLGNSILVRKAVDSRFKSLGEAVMLLFAKKFIPFDAKLVFKISGRYLLSSNFSLASWLTNKFKFFYVREDFVSTRLYSFSGKVVREWQRALIKSVPYLFLDYPIEYLLFKWVPKNLAEKVLLAGVSGSDSTTGLSINE